MRLICARCRNIEAYGDAYKCTACGYVLEAEYPDISSFRPKLGADMWSFAAALPFPGVDPVSLGEGMTPLTSGGRLANALGLTNVFIKNECLNPTGSFKDRALSVCVTAARELKKEGIVVASSGNGAASASAYAARAGLEAAILVPESTPDAKVTQARMCGAKLTKVPGSFTNSYKLAQKMAEEGYYNATTTFLNPYTMEGYKTIGFEIFLQLGRVPDWIILPVGAGPILGGIHKAFLELEKAGRSKGMPRLVAVQAENCSPIVKAFLAGSTVKAEDNASLTIASALADPLAGYEEDGDYTITCIKQSGGSAVALNETEILQSARLLAELEGIYAEPGGAVSVLAAKKLLVSGEIKPADKVVFVVTGHGLKFDYSGY